MFFASLFGESFSFFDLLFIIFLSGLSSFGIALFFLSRFGFFDFSIFGTTGDSFASSFSSSVSSAFFLFF
jgi:hypothetical protein